MHENFLFNLCRREMAKIAKMHGQKEPHEFTAIRYMDHADFKYKSASISKRLQGASGILRRNSVKAVRKYPVILNLYSKSNGKKISGYRQSLMAVNLFNSRFQKGHEEGNSHEVNEEFGKRYRFISKMQHPTKLIAKVFAFYLNRFLENRYTKEGKCLSDHCFAYRKNRSHHHLLTMAESWIFEKGHWFAMRTDIKSYFDCIREDRMREILIETLASQRVSDPNFVEWCMALAFPKKEASWQVKKRSKQKSQFTPAIKLQRAIGIPQGSPLSAPLSNLYLTPVDMDMESYGEECGFQYYRYADDIMVLCRTQNMMQKAAELFDKSISKHKLELRRSEQKTQFEDIRNGKVNFMGFEWTGETGKGRRKQMLQSKFLNFRHKITEATSMRLRRSYLKKKRSGLDEESYLLKRIVATINRKMLGQVKNKTQGARNYPLASHYNHGNEKAILKQMQELDRWVHYRVARFVVGSDEKTFKDGKKQLATKYVYKTLLTSYNTKVKEQIDEYEEKLYLHHMPRLFMDRQHSRNVTVYGLGH